MVINFRDLNFLVLVCAFTGMLGSCSSNQGPMKLYKVLEKQFANASTSKVISLGDVTDFDWDKVVFVRMQATASEFESVTGIQNIAFAEFDELVLFFKNGIEVFRDTRTYNPEKGFNGTYFLNFESDNVHVKVFDQAAAEFALEKKEIGNYSNIYLHRMRR